MRAEHHDHVKRKANGDEERWSNLLLVHHHHHHGEHHVVAARLLVVLAHHHHHHDHRHHVVLLVAISPRVLVHHHHHDHHHHGVVPGRGRRTVRVARSSVPRADGNTPGSGLAWVGHLGLGEGDHRDGEGEDGEYGGLHDGGCGYSQDALKLEIEKYLH